MEGVSPGDFSTSPCIFNPFAPRIEWKQLTDLLKDPEILSGSFNTRKKRGKGTQRWVCAHVTRAAGCGCLWAKGHPSFVLYLFGEFIPRMV